MHDIVSWWSNVYICTFFIMIYLILIGKYMLSLFTSQNDAKEARKKIKMLESRDYSGMIKTKVLETN